MRFDAWTFGLQAINALVLVWLLSRFLFKPVARIMAERQAAAVAVLDQAEAIRREAEQEHRALDAERARLAQGREAALQAAVAEAASTREHLLQTARSEADATRKRMEQELAAARRHEQLAADRRVTELAAAVAGRLLERLPACSLVEGFLDGLCARIAALPAASRGALATGPEPLVLAAPRSLSDPEREACQRAIERAVGGNVTLHPAVDANLIAGLELRGHAVVVANHLRADLARVQQELAHATG